MPILCDYATDRASEDAADTRHKPAIRYQVLWPMFWILPCLHTHNRIRYDINECLSHSSYHEEHRDEEAVGFVEEVYRDQWAKLNDSHQYYVRLSVCTSNWHIVTKESVDNFYAPGNVNNTHVDSHLGWFQFQICLKQILTRQDSNGPETMINVLNAKQDDEWLIILAH